MTSTTGTQGRRHAERVGVPDPGEPRSTSPELLRHRPRAARPRELPGHPAPTSQRRRLARVPRTALAADVVVIVIAMGLAAFARHHVSLFPGTALPLSNPLAAGLVIGALWLVSLRVVGAYDPHLFGAGTDEYRRVISAGLLTWGAVAVGLYLAQYELSRTFFVLAFGNGIVLLVLARFLMRRLLQRARRRGHLQHRVVIAGTGQQIDEIASVLARQPWLGFNIVGAITPPTEQAGMTPAGHRVWANTDEVAWVTERLDADTLLITGGAFRTSGEIRQAVWDLEQHDVQVIVAPNVTDIASERVQVRPVGGLPLIHIEPPRHREATRVAKRSFDVVGASCLLLVFSPLFLYAAWQIRRHDGGPVLFRQTRVGRDGVEFPCLKFRTMVVDAEDLLHTLHAQNGFDGGLFKMKEDPRVTAPGRWLRRFSIDELPQLVNVLRGDMSLVGPRPPLVSESSAYDAAARRRLHVRPGMTGLWQVSGRSDLSYSEAIRLDLYYVDNWSMVQDMTILMRTFSAVFASKGAY